MKLKRIHIENFRCYKEMVSVDFDNITTFIGKNDIGKSTIMEALEIFFNNDIVKLSTADLNNKAENKNVTISCEFEGLPTKLILDTNIETDLESEFLLTEDKTLYIKKVFDCNKKNPTSEVFIVANHPSAEDFSNLLNLKQRELQTIVNKRGLDVNKNINSEMRKAIWQSVDAETLDLRTTDICVSKPKDEVKDIWSKLENYIPSFALFQSDRNSTDGDNEVQSPMKYAVQMAIAEAEEEIKQINEKVKERAMEIANNTHAALQTLDSSLASTLSPKFDNPATSKWSGLYNISMNTDDDIPLNKRGSGVRRMILLSFFKAEAERKAKNSTKKDVIYAIEEPETSMHPNYQKLMINSFIELSQSNHCQVILTTHSPNLAKELPTDSLRFITRQKECIPIIKSGMDILPEIIQTLGILPEAESLQKVKVILCLEGPTDIPAFKCFNRCLRTKYNDIVNIESDEIAIIPLGGSALKYWVSQHYLKKLKCKEVHIYDRDVKDYQNAVNEINSRGDGSWGALTQKTEIENYLHPEAIKQIYDVVVDTTQDNVPTLFAEAFSQKEGFDGTMKGNKAKTYLSRVFDEAMTMEYLSEIGAEDEIKEWFDRIAKML